MVSREHLQRVWHANRGRLLLRTPGPLGLAYVLLVETNSFPELIVIFPDYAFRISLGTSSILLCLLTQALNVVVHNQKAVVMQLHLSRIFLMWCNDATQWWHIKYNESIRRFRYQCSIRQSTCFDFMSRFDIFEIPCHKKLTTCKSLHNVQYPHILNSHIISSLLYNYKTKIKLRC